MKVWKPIIKCSGETPQAFKIGHNSLDGFKTEQECQEWIDYCLVNGCFTEDEINNKVYPMECDINVKPTIY